MTEFVETCPINADAIYRHKKRGTLYKVKEVATLQAEGPLNDAEVVIYTDWPNQSRTWVRPASEFLDGRFEVLL